MFRKLKAIATIFVVKDEPKKREQLKTVKLQVDGGTTVRQFVAEALEKAGLDSLFECVDVQYSSKKFGKFLDVGYDQKVKNGREYKIKIAETVPAIKAIEYKAVEEDAIIVQELDLITCMDGAEDDENSSDHFTDAVTGIFDEAAEKCVTYAEVIAVGQVDDVQTPKEGNQNDLKHVKLSDTVTVFKKCDEGASEVNIVEGTAPELKPSTPSSVKK